MGGVLGGGASCGSAGAGSAAAGGRVPSVGTPAGRIPVVVAVGGEDPVDPAIPARVWSPHPAAAIPATAQTAMRSRLSGPRVVRLRIPPHARRQRFGQRVKRIL